MRKFIKIIGVLILVIALFSGISKCRERLCQISWLPLRTTIEYFFTPEDLYEGVFHEIIDVSKRSYEKEIPFKFKYVGSYEITLELYNFDWRKLKGKFFELHLRLKLDFYKDKNLIYSTTTSTDYHAITRGPDKPYNHALGLNTFFYVPKAVPHNADLLCKVTVIESDQKLNELYGPLKLTIERAIEW